MRRLFNLSFLWNRETTQTPNPLLQRKQAAVVKRQKQKLYPVWPSALSKSLIPPMNFNPFHKANKMMMVPEWRGEAHRIEVGAQQTFNKYQTWYECHIVVLWGVTKTLEAGTSLALTGYVFLTNLNHDFKILSNKVSSLGQDQGEGESRKKELTRI